MISISCLESKLLNNNNWYGRFQLAPFQKGEGLTVANALRRTLLAEKSNFFITWVDFYNAEIPYSVLTGMRESVFDILLNLKQVIFTSDKIIPNRSTFFKSASRKHFKSQKVKFLSKKRLKAASEINFLGPSFASGFTLTTGQFTTPYNSSYAVKGVKRQIELDKAMEKYLEQPNLNITPNNINNRTIEINQNLKNQKIRFKNVFCKNQILGKMINSNHQASPLIQLGIFNKNNSTGHQFEDRANSKKINSTYLGYICAKGPTVIYAKDIKLPKGLKCVDPDKYIVTLADDGLFYLRFALTTTIETLPIVNASNLSISINKGIKFNKVKLKTFPKILFKEELQSCSGFKIISSIVNKGKTLKKSNQQYLNNNQVHFPLIHDESHPIASPLLRKAYMVKNEIKIPWLSQIKSYNSKINSKVTQRVNYAKNLIKEQRLLLTNDSIKQFNFQNTSIVANIQKTCLLNIQVKHYYYKCGRFDRFLFDLIKPFKPTLKSTYYNFFSLKKNLFYQSNSLKVLGSIPLACIFLFTKSSSSPSIYFPIVSHILSGQKNFYVRALPEKADRGQEFSSQLSSLESDSLKNKYLLKWQKTFKFSKTSSIYDYFKKLTISQTALICFLSTKPRIKNKISLLPFGPKRLSIGFSSIVSPHLVSFRKKDTGVKRQAESDSSKNVLNSSAFKLFSLYQNLKQFFSFVAIKSRTLKLHKSSIEKPSPFIIPSLGQAKLPNRLYPVGDLSVSYQKNLVKNITWPILSHFVKQQCKYQGCILKQNGIGVDSLYTNRQTSFLWRNFFGLTLSNFGSTVNNLSTLNNSNSISGYIRPYSLFSKKSSLTNQPWINLNRYKSFNSVQLPQTLRTRPTSSIRQVSYKPMWIFSCHFQQKTNLKKSWLNHVNANSFVCAQTLPNQFLNASCFVKKTMKKTFNSIPTNSVILKPIYLNVEQIIYVLKQTTKFRKNQRINPRFFNWLGPTSSPTLSRPLWEKEHMESNDRQSRIGVSKKKHRGERPRLALAERGVGLRKLNYDRFYPTDYYLKFSKLSNFLYNSLSKYNESKTIQTKQPTGRPSVSHIWVFGSNFLFKNNLLDISLKSQAKTSSRLYPTGYSLISVSVRSINVGLSVVPSFMKPWDKFQNNSLYNSTNFYIPLKVICPNGVKFFKPLRYYHHALNQVLPFSLTRFPYFPQIAITNKLNLNDFDNSPSRPLPYNINIYNSKISFNLRYTYPFKYTIFETFLPFQSITSSSAPFVYNNKQKTRPCLKHLNVLNTDAKIVQAPTVVSRRQAKYNTDLTWHGIGPSGFLKRNLDETSPVVAHLAKFNGVKQELKSNEVVEKEMLGVISYRHFDSIHYNESFKIYTTLAYTCFKTYEPNLSKYHNFNKQNQKKLQDSYFKITNFQDSYLRYDQVFTFNMFLEPLIFDWPLSISEPLIQYFSSKGSRRTAGKNKYLLDKISKIPSDHCLDFKPIPVLKLETFSTKQIIIYKMICKIFKQWPEGIFYNNNLGQLSNPLKNHSLPSIFDSTYKWRILNNPNLNDAFIVIPCTWSLNFQSNGLNSLENPLIKSSNLTNWFGYFPITSQSFKQQINLDSFVLSIQESFLRNYAFLNVKPWFESKIMFLDFFGKSKEIIKNKLYWSGSDYGFTPSGFTYRFTPSEAIEWDPTRNNPCPPEETNKKNMLQTIKSNSEFIGEKLIIRDASTEFTEIQAYKKKNTKFTITSNYDDENIDNSNSIYDFSNIYHPDEAIGWEMLEKSSSVVLKSKQLYLRYLNKNVLKKSLKKLAINFENIYYKNFLWNSRKITLRILNNAVLPLVANRKFNISHFVPKKNSMVTGFINKTMPKNVSFNPSFSELFINYGQVFPRISPLDPALLSSIEWNYRQSINQQRWPNAQPALAGRAFWPKIGNYQMPRFYTIRHKTLKTTNFMCEKTYPIFTNGREDDFTYGLTPIQTINSNPITKRQIERFEDSFTIEPPKLSPSVKSQVELESDFSFLNSKRRPFFYGSLGHFQANTSDRLKSAENLPINASHPSGHSDEAPPIVSHLTKQWKSTQEKDEFSKSSFVEFLTRKKGKSENNEKYLLPYNQIIPEKLASFRKYQWNKSLTQGSKLSNESNINSRNDSKTKPLPKNNLWRSSFFYGYSLYAISTKSDLFLQNLINFSGLKNQTNDDYDSFQPSLLAENTNSYDSWTSYNNEIKENLDEPVFFKEMQLQSKQNHLYQFLNLKSSIKSYEKTIQKILKSQKNPLINDFPNEYSKWQKGIHLTILNRLKKAVAGPLEFNKKKNLDEATQNFPILEKNQVKPEPVVPDWISLTTRRKKYLKRWGGIEKLKNYQHDFGNPLRRGIRKELLSIYHVTSLIKLDQKSTSEKSFLRIANQQVLKSWKSTICTAKTNINFCFYYPRFIKNCNLPWKKSKLIFDIPKYWLNKRTIHLKLSSKPTYFSGRAADFLSKKQWPITKNFNKKINSNLFRFYTQLASSSSKTHQKKLHTQSKRVISLQDKQLNDIQPFKNLISSINIHTPSQDNEPVGSYGIVGYFTIKEGLNSIYKVNYIVESHVSESGSASGFTLNNNGSPTFYDSQYRVDGVKRQSEPYKSIESNPKPINRLEFHSNQKNELTNHSFIDFGDNLERLQGLKIFENLQRDSATTDSLTVSNFLNDNYSFAPNKTIMLNSFNELMNTSINRSQIQDENEYIQIDIWTNGELSPRQALLNAFKKLFELFYNLSKYNCLKPIEI